MRQRTGKGQHIDIAMIDATFATDDQVHYAMEDAEDTAALPNDVGQREQARSSYRRIFVFLDG